MTARRGTRPSPSKIVNTPSASEGSEEYEDETLQAIIRNKQERVAQTTGNTIPLALEHKVVLNFIDLWCEDPNTPIHDLKLPPRLSHMVTSFISETKWKDQQEKQARAAKVKKEKYLKQNILNQTREKLASTQEEMKTLTDKYTSLHADRKGVKVRFVKAATDAIEEYNNMVAAPKQLAISHASYTVQLPDSDEDEEMAVDGSARNATTGEFARPECSHARPEENAISPVFSKVKKVTLLSASDVKKTKAAEKEAKKRKASTPTKSSQAKHEKTQSTSSSTPADATSLSIAPSYMLVPFDEEPIIPEHD
ncbi:hypothetical protein ZWY2020_057661 [Hordeum vulgare]|nr:hypothetical protein ZWY2020_057661 [Hordeum vulgare]